MTQTASGIAGALGIGQPDEAKPRLTLEPARCAVGISRSGAGFRVIHTLSGKELGMVYRTSEPGWGYWGFVLAGTTELHKPVWANATAAAVALAAHDLNRRLELVAARLGAVEWARDAKALTEGREREIRGLAQENDGHSSNFVVLRAVAAELIRNCGFAYLRECHLEAEVSAR